MSRIEHWWLGNPTGPQDKWVPVSPGTPLPVTIASSASSSGFDDGTIVAANTPQEWFGAEVPANGYQIVNPNNVAVLFVSDTVVAPAVGTPGTMLVYPAGTYQTPAGYKPQGPVYVSSDTDGAAVTGKRW